MARTVKDVKLDTKKARTRLDAGRQPHWVTLRAGHSHLGWQRWPEDRVGRWVLRRRRGGRYSIEQVGIADDAALADGVNVLDYEMARARATELASGDVRPAGRLTVSKCINDYIDHQRSLGKPTAGAKSAAVAHILPALGKYAVDDLTSDQLQEWLASVAAGPAHIRTRPGDPQRFKASPTDEEGVRRRRASANRTLTVLRAALNYAYEAKRVSSADAWGKRLKRFDNVDSTKGRYMTMEEATRLLNGCDPDFRSLVRCALETGARFSELARLRVDDFNPDANTIAVRRSKTGKPRHVPLTPEASAFFRRLCAGRTSNEAMLLRADGLPWRAGSQDKPMRLACEHGRITPRVTFHDLRHAYASAAVMRSMPLLVVAKILGHRDTSMVERCYGHLAPSFITEAVHTSAPRFAVDDCTNVAPLRRPKQ
jgi:integrase